MRKTRVDPALRSHRSVVLSQLGSNYRLLKSPSPQDRADGAYYMGRLAPGLLRADISIKHALDELLLACWDRSKLVRFRADQALRKFKEAADNA